MSYFILTSGEDGIHVEGPLSESEVQKELNGRVEGVKPEYHPVFLDRIPHIDKGYFSASENTTIVIRGEIIIPGVVKFATEFKV